MQLTHKNNFQMNQKRSKKGFALYLSMAFFFALFSFGNLAHASVLYDQSTTGDSFLLNNDVGGFPTGHHFYSRFIPPNHIGNLFPGTGGWTATGDIRYLKIRLASTNVPACNTISNVLIAKTDGNYISGTIGTPSTSNTTGDCVFPITGASNAGQAVGSIFVCTTGTCNNTNGNLVLEGNSFNVGYTVDGNQDHEYTGGFGFQFCDSGGCGSSGFTPLNTTSRIDTFTYATSTGIANVTGYWNATSTTGITERLSFWQTSTQLGMESYVQVTASTTGAFNFSFEFLGLPTPYNGSTTTAPILAPYTLHASLDQYDGNYYDPFGTSGLDQSKYITNLDATSTTVSTLTYGLPDYTTSPGLQQLPEYECAITSITGCLKNAGIWLFYPTSDTVEQFKTLGTDLQGKFPFAYAYGVNTLRQELWNSSQTSTTTIALNVKLIPGHGTSTIELLSASKLNAVPYAGTIKTILGWILWLYAIEFIYYRVIRSHDPNTPQ